jgi:hypothetical protein
MQRAEEKERKIERMLIMKEDERKAINSIRLSYI